MKPAVAQDPEEIFDVVTFEGVPTGARKRRADIHRDGDWHRAIHVWVISEIGGVQYLHVQRRSMYKDTSPGRLDPTVGGHLNAGETWREAIRETEEEIGLRVMVDDLIYAGTRRGIGEGEPGIIDREIQDVFLVRCDAALDTYRLNSHEVSALIRMRIADVLRLFTSEVDTIEATSFDGETGVVGQVQIQRHEFGRQLDRYLYRVAIAARSYLSGETHFAV